MPYAFAVDAAGGTMARGTEYGASGRNSAGLVMSGLAWRARSSLAMFVVAVFGTGLSAFGIMYLHSADQSILSSQLSAAAPASLGLTLQPRFSDQSAQLRAALARLPRPAAGARWYGAPISTELVHVTTTARGQLYASSMLARTGACRHLAFASGGCARTAHGVDISTRSARALGLHLGSTMQVGVSGPDRRSVTRTVAVRGIYRPGNPSAPYWWGTDYFLFGTRYDQQGSHSSHTLNLDTVFANAAAVRAVAAGSTISHLAQVPLVTRSLTVGVVPRFRSALIRYESDEQSGAGIQVSTQVGAVLRAAATTEHTSGTIVGVVDLELVVLGLFVLYFVASRTAWDREADVRLAELRGYRPRSTVLVALSEPVLLVAVAVPVGIMCAWVAAQLVAGAVAAPGVGASLTPLALAAAVVTGVVGVAATALGMRRILTRPAGSGRNAARTSTGRLVADVLAVAVSGASVFELVATGVSQGSHSRPDPLAALAPGLLAIGVGVLGIRVLPVVLRAFYARTARTSRVALALALRRVSRRPEFAGQIMLVTVAVGLAAFAVSGWAIAGNNRSVRNAFDVGASKVLSVDVRPGVTFVSAVRRADGGGDSAMAAVVEHGSDGETLAVDASRLPTVATWPSGLGTSASRAAKLLAGPGSSDEPLTVHGTELRAVVDGATDVHPEPLLFVNLFSQDFVEPETVYLGPLAPGVRTYQAKLPRPCASACRVVSLTMTWTGLTYLKHTRPSPVLSFVWESLSARQTGAWHLVHAGLDTGRWTSTTRHDVLAASARGLRATIRMNLYGVLPAIEPPGVLPAIPVVVTPETASRASGHGGPLLTGLDGNTIAGRTVGEVAALPGVGDVASLVDLRLAEQFMSTALVRTTDEVWVSASAPPGIQHALTARGVAVVGERTVAAVDGQLAHAGVTLAYFMFLLAGVVAVALALGASTFAILNGARRRAPELAAMRAVGVPVHALRRELWAEHALALGAGVVLGATAGLAGAALALRSVPEFVALPPGPPLVFGLPVVDLVVTIGGSLLALLVVADVSAAHVVRLGAVPEQIGSGGRAPGQRRRAVNGEAEGTGTRPAVVSPQASARVAPATSSTGQPSLALVGRSPALDPAPTGSSRSSSAPGGVPVHLASVVHIYHQAGEDVVGLRGVDLAIEPGEMVALLGPSGMGKTTLMRLMAGVMTASAGTVVVGEHSVSRLRLADRRRLRSTDIGYIVQGTYANVLPFATVLQNVWFAQHGARARGHRPPWSPVELLELLGLTDLAHARVATLPYGPQQLVAVTAGVSSAPRLLLADEPTSQLADDAVEDVVRLLRRINAEFGTTVVIVTHDQYVASCFPRTVTIRDGRVESEGVGGEEYSVIDGSGALQLPLNVLKRLRPGMKVKVVLSASGAEIRDPGFLR